MADPSTNYRKFIVPSPENFNSVLEAVSAEHCAPVFIMFYGERDSDGISWCPDCTAAEPAVKEALSEAGTSAALVEAVVARAEYKGNADYPYRKDERIKLQAIPQLVRWEDGKSKESIVLETPDTDAVRALVLGE